MGVLGSRLVDSPVCWFWFSHTPRRCVGRVLGRTSRRKLVARFIAHRRRVDLKVSTTSCLYVFNALGAQDLRRARLLDL